MLYIWAAVSATALLSQLKVTAVAVIGLMRMVALASHVPVELRNVLTHVGWALYAPAPVVNVITPVPLAAGPAPETLKLRIPE